MDQELKLVELSQEGDRNAFEELVARYGKRIFNMAPIHHHFELKGWAEPKVIVRFWIISIFFALMAVSTLKLR